MAIITTKRIYEAPSKDDGYRILVDRLWPRGVSKQRAALDDWAKQIAPSTDLRVWFGHDPLKFKEFGVRYDHELDHNPATKDFLKLVGSKDKVTLLYAAKNTAVSHALVLKAYIEAKL